MIRATARAVPEIEDISAFAETLGECLHSYSIIRNSFRLQVLNNFSKNVYFCGSLIINPQTALQFLPVEAGTLGIYLP